MAALAGLAVAGCLTSAAGIAGLWQLKQNHLVEEILVSESPRTFQAWLANGLVNSKSDKADGEAGLAKKVAGRLLLMRIDQQFALVQAMMQDRFWSDLSFNEAGRRRALIVGEDAVSGALSLSPGSGALWLMAAKIRTIGHGYDQQAAAYLRASHVLSAGEGAVVRARFVFSLGILPLLDTAALARFEQDRAIVRQIDRQLFDLATRRIERQFGNRPSGARPYGAGQSDDVPEGAINVGPVGTIRPVPALRGAAR